MKIKEAMIFLIISIIIFLFPITLFSQNKEKKIVRIPVKRIQHVVEEKNSKLDMGAPTEGFVHGRINNQPDSVKAYTPGVPNDTIRTQIWSNGSYIFDSDPLGDSFNVAAKDWSFVITKIRNKPAGRIYVPDVYPNNVTLDVWGLAGAWEPYGVTFHLKRTGKNTWGFLPPSSQRGHDFWFYHLNIGNEPVHGDSGIAYYWAQGPPTPDYLRLAEIHLQFDTTRFGKNIWLATDSLYQGIWLPLVGSTPYLFSVQDVQPKTAAAGGIVQKVITSNDSIPPWSFGRDYQVTITLKPGEQDSIVLQGNGHLNIGYNKDTVSIATVLTQGIYPRRTVISPSKSPQKVYYDTLIITPASLGWKQLNDMPQGAMRKGCKKGTSMTYGNNKIYAIKGGTLEFYSYNPETGQWSQETNLPPGEKGKAKGGSFIVYANNGIFYKPGNDINFYFKELTSDVWQQRAGYLCNNKRIKEGSAGAVKGETIYMTVGGRKSKDKLPVIAKYSIRINKWFEEYVPSDLVPKGKFQKGAGIVVAKDGTIFVSTGTTPDLLKRTPDGIWSKETTIPTNKGKFRGFITYNEYDNSIYVAEGNNQSRFEKYNLDNRIWVELPSWPLGTEKKNPKDGALISDGCKIYALKGNNTKGFYQYIPLDNYSQNSEERISNIKIDKLNNYKDFPQVYKIYDVLGREIKHTRQFRKGIFLLKSSTGKYKVIIIK